MNRELIELAALLILVCGLAYYGSTHVEASHCPIRTSVEGTAAN